MKIQIPDSPAGKHVQACLDIVNTCDWETLHDRITQHYDSSILNQYPPFIQVAIHKGFYYMTAGKGYKFLGVQQENACSLTIQLQNNLTEHHIGVELSVSPESPHKIIKQLKHQNTTPAANQGLERIYDDDEVVSRLDQCIVKMAEDEMFTGTVLLTKYKSTLYRNAFGMANRSFMIPNNIDTKFNIASLGKMFTGVAIAQLHEAGELDFSETVGKYISPEWLDAGIANKVQIRHLLTHTSGLGDYFPLLYQKGSFAYYRSLKDYQPLVQDVTLAFEPGTQWSYSNTGMLLLGVIIEKVSGGSYYDYIQEYIYVPSGMGNSGAFEADQVIFNRAIGYSKMETQDKVIWLNNLVKPILKGSPSGGSYSTVDDIMRFDSALQNNILLRPEMTHQVLSAKPELHSPFYGYGFFVREDESGRCVSHGGDGRGINCQFRSYLDKGYTLVVLSNSDPPGANIVSDIFDAMLPKVIDSDKRASEL